MSRSVKCPKCKSSNVQVLNMNTKTSLNLNPLHPLTVFNHKPKGKIEFMCSDCGRRFKQK